eukprot:Tamp_09023.p1 GENE.Tamp_09023~~Tamp_09023.p1  ORF type:complete len:254 (+),score=51.75 Tamp_09023:99-860(+)
MSQQLTPREESLCRQFSEFTSASVEVAAVCLRRNKWNIHTALEAFWEDPEAFQPPVPKSDAAAIEGLYNKYKEADENAISVDGLINFCADLDIEPSDIRMLVFCFFLQVKTAVRWSKQEFIGGLTRLGCDSIEKIRAVLPQLQADLLGAAKFKAFYEFAFDVSRAEGQKVLDLQTGIALWRMLLEGKFHHLELWCTYLENVFQKSITKDTWKLLLEFSQTANETLSNIDLDTSAWPVVIDEFVEYARAQGIGK